MIIKVYQGSHWQAGDDQVNKTLFVVTLVTILAIFVCLKIKSFICVQQNPVGEIHKIGQQML